MDFNGFLDAQVVLEGEKLPTLRQIIEAHFVAAAGGNQALGKLSSSQYVRLLGQFFPSEGAPGTADPRPGAQPGGERGQGDETRSKGKSEAENLLGSFGIPVTEDGQVDIMGAIAGAFTPEGRKTPVGALVGALVKGVGDAAGKPRA